MFSKTYDSLTVEMLAIDRETGFLKRYLLRKWSTIRERASRFGSVLFAFRELESLRSKPPSAPMSRLLPIAEFCKGVGFVFIVEAKSASSWWVFEAYKPDNGTNEIAVWLDRFFGGRNIGRCLFLTSKLCYRHLGLTDFACPTEFH